MIVVVAVLVVSKIIDLIVANSIAADFGQGGGTAVTILVVSDQLAVWSRNLHATRIKPLALFIRHGLFRGLARTLLLRVYIYTPFCEA